MVGNHMLWLFRRFASGILGPVTFGLGLHESCLVILFFNLICAVPSAYLLSVMEAVSLRMYGITVDKYETGFRQQSASRYMFG